MKNEKVKTNDDVYDDAYKQFIEDYIQSKNLQRTEELQLVYIVSPYSKTLTPGCFPEYLKK